MRAPGFALAVCFGLGSLLSLTACTGPHKLISARHVSCAPRKLEIHDLISLPTREDWVAVCEDKRYACYTREHGRRLIYGCRLISAGDAGAPGDAATSDAGGAPTASDAAVASFDAGAP